MKRVEVVSFGFKHEGKAAEFLVLNGYFIVDCRNLPNPWYMAELRNLDGTDPRILKFLQDRDPLQVEWLLELAHASKSDKIAFGCHGGKHRSVALAAMFRADLSKQVQIPPS